MQRATAFSHWRWMCRCLAVGLSLAAACVRDAPVDAPRLPSAPVIPAAYRGAAFVMDVSPSRKTVKISAPTSTTVRASAQRAINGSTLSRDGAASYSLLGGDVIELAASNISAGGVGAMVPGKVLVTMDLTIVNKLQSVHLDTPTFPTPPAGASGVQLFPFEILVEQTTGGVASSGNDVQVAAPRYGAVAPSNDWDGAPHNFFNDAGCLANSNDCFRYESFGAINAGAASLPHSIGFLIDPTVGDFRVRMIVAGDLRPTTAHKYYVAGTWGTITNTGPTGRQVTMNIAADFGSAPGLPDVAGANADPMAGMSFGMVYDKTRLRYQSRVSLQPAVFDLVAANEPAAPTASCPTTLCVAITSTTLQTAAGIVPLVQLTFNIPVGAQGVVAPQLSVSELLMTTALINKTASVIVQQPPALTIP